MVFESAGAVAGRNQIPDETSLKKCREVTTKEPIRLPVQEERPVKFLLRVSGLIDAMNERLSYVADWLVLLSCAISAANAFSRYAFSVSSNAWLEIQWYMFGALVMLGASYTLKRNEHVRVDIVYANVSTRRQIGIDIFGTILFLLPATLIMAYLSWPIFHNAWVENEISSNAGGLIRWPIKIFLPLGFALLSLQGVSELIKRIAMLTGHMQANLHYERPLQ
jgi:TRAP-type mannitol/chloroaromatic compound transport system permease small subunit